MIHRKKNAPALQRRDVSTVSLVSSCFREFAYVFFYPGVSGSVLLSIPWNCVLIKTLLLFLGTFSQVFVYPGILLSGVARFSTWWDCLLLWGLLLGTLLRSSST